MYLITFIINFIFGFLTQVIFYKINIKILFDYRNIDLLKSIRSTLEAYRIFIDKILVDVGKSLFELFIIVADTSTAQIIYVTYNIYSPFEGAKNILLKGREQDIVTGNKKDDTYKNVLLQGYIVYLLFTLSVLAIKKVNIEYSIIIVVSYFIKYFLSYIGIFDTLVNIRINKEKNKIILLAIVSFGITVISSVTASLFDSNLYMLIGEVISCFLIFLILNYFKISEKRFI